MTTDVLSWDVGNWSSALDFWKRHGDLEHPPLECLEIGANRGGLSVWLASQGHRVVCSDLDRCEQHARPLVERHGLLDRVTFADVDALAIPFRDEFDVVIFKSVLGGVGRDGAIDRQRRAVEQMYGALKPGGRLLFAENLTGSRLHKFMRARFVQWGNSWRYVTIEEMLAFLRPFSDVSFSTTGVLGTFGRNEKQRELLSTVDRAALNTITPPAWRYIIYGVATK